MLLVVPEYLLHLMEKYLTFDNVVQNFSVSNLEAFRLLFSNQKSFL